MSLAVRIHDDIKLHEVNMILGRHWKILSDHNKIITHLLLLRKQASFGTLFVFFSFVVFLFSITCMYCMVCIGRCIVYLHCLCGESLKFLCYDFGNFGGPLSL